MDKPKILIVDDDQGVLTQLKWALDDAYVVLCASNKSEALAQARGEKPGVVALDINLDGSNFKNKEGIDILDEIKNNIPFCKVVMITGNESKELALEAVGRGAFDYFQKPINVEDLKVILKRACYIRQLEIENKRLQEESARRDVFEEMVGNSKKIEEVFKMIRRVAPSEATVLITGESGTGKELVARAVHSLSGRRDKPFVVINCGAIPENLLESELFGHEKGSFTDAHAKRVGKLERADSGTVFLDEIGEMSLGLQVKLLRFLQNKVIERVGGNAPIELDIRVIAATNQDLKEGIKNNSFREDLFYRLSVLTISVPPLRERGDDVFILANYFLRKYKGDAPAKEIKGFMKEAKDIMKSYRWGGNVRELENKVRRALILAEGGFITPEELGFTKEEEEKSIERLSLKEARSRVERDLIKKALSDSKGNMSLAAKMLGVTRPTLYDLMKKYNISSYSI